MAKLYTHSIGNQLLNKIMVFKMHDSVSSVRYYSVCNVLHLWKISLIPTYRAYRLDDNEQTFLDKMKCYIGLMNDNVTRKK